MPTRVKPFNLLKLRHQTLIYAILDPIIFHEKHHVIQFGHRIMMQMSNNVVVHSGVGIIGPNLESGPS